MTAPIVIKKNSREEIRVVREVYQGSDLINLRVWHKADDDSMRPTRKGLAFKFELLPAVMKALQAQTAQEDAS